MAQWSLKERLQPSLLDRLTDTQPEKKKESASQQVLSQRQFKNAVIRDLAWLLNTTSLDSVLDLTEYPEVKNSVINYGMQDISGHTSHSIDALGLQKTLRKVIQEYEPRIIRNSLKVRVESNPDQNTLINASR